MRTLMIFIAVLSLVLLIMPSILFLADRMELHVAKWIMLIATVIWFLAGTPWLWKRTN